MKLYNLQGKLLKSIQTKSGNIPRDKDKHISENRNLIICVADRGAGQVVVVNQAGKLRLRYTGHPFITKGSFYPRGITTDSQSQILKADSNNDYIHILDKEGQFLCYIENCYLQHPWGLRVDTKDNLFVAEFHIDSLSSAHVCV
ncbi:protein lin-41-like [Saccostrea cucullata]|uniref:protein lin-41-like n=1 Tax=Saccostrea cuccullata TaxID=36930 RepID=UPI002ED475E6